MEKDEKREGGIFFLIFLGGTKRRGNWLFIPFFMEEKVCRPLCTCHNLKYHSFCLNKNWCSQIPPVGDIGGISPMFLQTYFKKDCIFSIKNPSISFSSNGVLLLLKNLYERYIQTGFTSFKVAEPLWGYGLLLTIKSPGIPCTYLINDCRMKDWVDLEATKC